MQHISSKLTLIHEDIQELINITRSRNDINVSQIVDTLKRELKISFNIEEEQPFPNSQDQIRADSLQNIFNIRKPILSLWKRKFNERKQSFWNYLRFQNTSVFYAK